MGLGLQTLTTSCTAYPSWKKVLYSTSKWLQRWPYVFKTENSTTFSYKTGLLKGGGGGNQS